MRKKIFLVISEEDTICPECGSPLCRRDRKLRVHKEAGGKKSWFAINRLKCTNEKCRRLHNELLECMIPYKHYGSDIIEDVVGSDELETENYPCEATMKHWKWWNSQKWSKHRRTDEIDATSSHGFWYKVPEIQWFFAEGTEGKDKPWKALLFCFERNRA